MEEDADRRSHEMEESTDLRLLRRIREPARDVVEEAKKCNAHFGRRRD